jgi:hypothetical protein
MRVYNKKKIEIKFQIVRKKKKESERVVGEGWLILSRSSIAIYMVHGVCTFSVHDF